MNEANKIEKCDVCGYQHYTFIKTQRTVSFSCYLSPLNVFMDHDIYEGITIRINSDFSSINLRQKNDITWIYFSFDTKDYSRITATSFIDICFDKNNYYEVLGKVLELSVKYINNRDLL